MPESVRTPLSDMLDIGCEPDEDHLANEASSAISIGFVWPEDKPFSPWAGGSETYTINQINELTRRGIGARLLVSGNTRDSLPLPGLPVHVMKNTAELSETDDTLVFVLYPRYDTGPLRRQSYAALHVPAQGMMKRDAGFFRQHGIGGHIPIVPSNFMARHWQNILSLPQLPPVVYPPINPVFGRQPRIDDGHGVPRLLFAGRPTPKKGVYTLLASLHEPPLHDSPYYLTVVKTTNSSGDSELVNPLLDAHPLITAVGIRNDAAGIAALYTEHDVTIMPSVWEEPFGMISVEAQHSGCRVVASDIGGLPETDCGGLVPAKPNDPEDLARAIGEAMGTGPLNRTERSAAALHFTPEDSVNALLRAIRHRTPA